MNDLIIGVILAALVGIGFGASLAFAASEGAWKRDCKALGAHILDGKVYDCKERP